MGGGSHHRPGLSFANAKSSSGFVNSARQERASRKAGGSMFSQSVPDAGSQRRKSLYIVVAVVLSLALAIGAGVIVYRQTAQNALKPSVDGAAAAALVAAQDGEVTWTLLIVEESADDSPSTNHIGSLALVSADPDNAKTSFVWIPTTMRAYVAGYGYMSVEDCFEMGDQQAFVSACSELTGVSFSHVAMGTQQGVSAMLKDLGLQTGTDNAAAAVAVAKKVLDSTSDQLSQNLKVVEDCIDFDMSTKDLAGFVNSVKSADSQNDVFSVDIPVEDEQTEEGYNQLKADDWATMSTRINGGLDPVAGKAELANSSRIRSTTSVTIWNGVGVSGIASDCSDYIKKKGWQLESSGNAASFVYKETLVVYKYDSQKKNAELLVSDLGQGRVVPSAARYSFDGDILIVIGSDYKPF